MCAYTGDMATAERRSPTSSGALTNDEAATLIGMILENTSTSAPSRVEIPDSPRSLADMFPAEVLAGV